MKAYLKVYFDPKDEQDYEVSVPVMIDDKKKPQAEIILKGQGAYPRLFFDRKEVILPIVPLGFTAETTFKIISDGYDNVNITEEIPQDRGYVNLKLEFEDGKTLGLINKKIRVKA